MDEMTLKVMSSSCKMTEITDEGISCKLSLPKDSVFLRRDYYLPLCIRSIIDIVLSARLGVMLLAVIYMFAKSIRFRRSLSI
jgi:hypothetical protein